MKFGSVCSGIEAASVAWQPLGWEASWFAEIEPFPSAVLSHHYPSVPNLGDMTTISARIRSGEVSAPDVLCGGTPCQAFSVAGLRRSLDDARGNLSLTFCEIANELDATRLARGDLPAIIFWENVPGVLSTKDNAFGCFLAGLAGEDDPLVAPGGKWTNAGCVLGPKRAVAWRVFDAQYFGVAQRRRRVFVVASARNGFDPATVLFEFDGLRRDTTPSREAGEITAAGTLRSTDGGCDVDHARAGQLQPTESGVITMAHGQGGAEVARERSPTLTCNHEAPIAAYAVRTANTSANGHGIAEEVTHTLDRAQGQAVCVTGDITHTLKAEGFDASEDGTGRGTPLVPVLQYDHACVCGYGYFGAIDSRCPKCGSGDGMVHGEAREVLQPVAFDTTQITSKANYSNPRPGDPCHPLAAGAHAPAIAFPANLSGTQHASTEDLSPALGALNPTAVAHVEIMPTMTAGGPSDSSHNQVSGQMRDAYMVPTTAMQVRRLTPVECERLQGFPDGYTQIPWRKKPASECPDGPRYKALGNSWAVPNAAWIGRRIEAAVKQLQHANDNNQRSEAAA